MVMMILATMVLEIVYGLFPSAGAPLIITGDPIIDISLAAPDDFDWIDASLFLGLHATLLRDTVTGMAYLSAKIGTITLEEIWTLFPIASAVVFLTFLVYYKKSRKPPRHLTRLAEITVFAFIFAFWKADFNDSFDNSHSLPISTAFNL